ncbi:hypothetical protein BCEP4_50057 [Burkholderia cepacia]|nr:hypothetical protein BCEP4_50057 [Burkholderia cepacia]
MTGHALPFSLYPFHPAGLRCGAHPCVVPARRARRV